MGSGGVSCRFSASVEVAMLDTQPMARFSAIGTIPSISPPSDAKGYTGVNPEGISDRAVASWAKVTNG